MMAREQELLARANAQLLVNSPHSQSLIGGGSPYLGLPHTHQSGYHQGLRRSRSFGSLPGGGYSPYLGGTSPFLGGGGHHAPHIQLSPRLGSRGVSPNRLYNHPPSPRVINNYTIHNSSPHLDAGVGYNSGFGGGIGYHDPPVIDPNLYGNEGMIGDSFVITDLDFDENGRQVGKGGVFFLTRQSVKKSETIDSSLSFLSLSVRIGLCRRYFSWINVGIRRSTTQFSHSKSNGKCTTKRSERGSFYRDWRSCVWVRRNRC